MAKGKNGFDKFMNPEPKPAAKKEAFRAEKRRAKADARAAGEAYRQEKKARAQGWSINERDDKGIQRPARAESNNRSSADRSAPKRPAPAPGRREEAASKPFQTRNTSSGAGKAGHGVRKNISDDQEKNELRSWADHFVKDKPSTPDKPFIPARSSDGRFKVPTLRETSDRKSFAERGDRKPAPERNNYTTPVPPPKSEKAGRDHDWAQKRIGRKIQKESGTPRSEGTIAPAAEDMPLNKFIAHAGICGRREAADIVRAGKVTVNGDIVYEPGYKVSENDDIRLTGKKLQKQVNLQYILLNKPKDYITTMKDPEGRKTVLDLVKDAANQRIYPVGRLDRNTTGVLLLTNDGELAQKLTHPSFQVKKIYEVKLDKVLSRNDFDAILKGVELEDGLITADSLAYADAKDKSIIGIEIHSGKNRIVRRLFEHLGYDVRNLDRVMFANLTKKNVERGTWRFLKEKEVRNLKFLNSSFTRK